MFFSVASLKLLIAALQLTTTILFFRTLGGDTFGTIVLTLSQIEMVFLLSIPGIQKLALSNVINGYSLRNLFLLKLTLAVFCASIFTFIDNSILAMQLAVLVLFDHINSFFRSIVHAQKRFVIVSMLDGMRPIAFIVFIFTYWIFGIDYDSTLFLFAYFISVIAEMTILFFFIRDYLEKNKKNKYKIKLVDLLLSSGFSIPSIIMRRFPIVLAGHILRESTAFVLIVMQFVTVINYMASSVMTQLSVQLLDKERKSIALNFSKKRSVQILLFAICYTIIFCLVDFLLPNILKLIYKYQSDYTFSIFSVYLMPICALLWQFLFYFSLGKEDYIYSKIIFFVMGITIVLFGGIFLSSELLAFLNFGLLLSIPYFFLILLIALLSHKTFIKNDKIQKILK